MRRLSLGMRQIDLAVRAGLSLTTVRQAEDVQYGLSAQSKKKIARALGSSISELFGEPEAQGGTAEAPLVKGL